MNRIRTPPRSHLRLADLKQRQPVGWRLLNVKVPADIAENIGKIAAHLQASKTEVIVALVKAGLERVRAGRRQKKEPEENSR